MTISVSQCLLNGIAALLPAPNSLSSSLLADWRSREFSDRDILVNLKATPGSHYFSAPAAAVGLLQAQSAPATMPKRMHNLTGCAGW